MRVWDGRTGKFVATLRGHVAAVYRLAWSADSRLLVSASKDSTLKVSVGSCVYFVGACTCFCGGTTSCDTLFLAWCHRGEDCGGVGSLILCPPVHIFALSFLSLLHHTSSVFSPFRAFVWQRRSRR